MLSREYRCDTSFWQAARAAGPARAEIQAYCKHVLLMLRHRTSAPDKPTQPSMQPYRNLVWLRLPGGIRMQRRILHRIVFVGRNILGWRR